MPHPYITHLTFPKIALLVGIDPSNIWRRAMKGELGSISNKRPMLLSVSEVETALDRYFTVDQIEAATKACAFKRPRKLLKAQFCQGGEDVI